MRDLSRGALGKPLVEQQAGCIDCGSYAFFAHNVTGGGGKPLQLASLMPVPKSVEAAGIGKVVGWLEAIGLRALETKRKRPFGLELPIVDGLTEPPVDSREPAEVVFDVEHGMPGMRTGVVIDTRGDVYRYRQRGRDARESRRVGNVAAAALERVVGLAKVATSESHVEERGSRTCTTVTWTPATTTSSEVLSNDCQRRLSGASADAVIAWAYAVDEQAAPVIEDGWPTKYR